MDHRAQWCSSLTLTRRTGECRWTTTSALTLVMSLMDRLLLMRFTFTQTKISESDTSWIQCNYEFVQSWCFDTILILGALSWRGLHEWHLRGRHGQESLDFRPGQESLDSWPGKGSLKENRCSVFAYDSGGGIISTIVCTIECWFRNLKWWQIIIPVVDFCPILTENG